MEAGCFTTSVVQGAHAAPDAGVWNGCGMSGKCVCVCATQPSLAARPSPPATCHADAARCEDMRKGAGGLSTPTPAGTHTHARIIRQHKRPPDCKIDHARTHARRCSRLRATRTCARRRRAINPNPVPCWHAHALTHTRTPADAVGLRLRKWAVRSGFSHHFPKIISGTTDTHARARTHAPPPSPRRCSRLRATRTCARRRRARAAPSLAPTGCCPSCGARARARAAPAAGLPLWVRTRQAGRITHDRCHGRLAATDARACAGGGPAVHAAGQGLGSRPTAADGRCEATSRRARGDGWGRAVNCRRQTRPDRSTRQPPE
jgi:hypothetical protein